MVFNKQGQKTGVKGFTYELGDDSDSGRAGFFQAGVKENANVWVKHYTSDAAFETADSRFGSVGQVGGLDVRTQAPNSGGSNTDASDFFSVHQIPDGTEFSKFSLNTGGRNIGIAWTGEYYWVSSRFGGGGGNIYKFDNSGTQKAHFSFDGSDPAGVAWDGNYVWVAGIGSNTFYQFKEDGTRVARHGTPFQPRGISFDGTYIWTGAGGGTTVFYRMKTDGSKVNSFDVGSSIQDGGVAFDGKYIYTTNLAGSTIYRFDQSGTQIDNFSVTPSTGGLTWEGEYLTMSSQQGNHVYDYTGSASLDLSYQVSGFSIAAGPLTLNVSESIGVNDTKDFEQDLFRTYGETLTADDTDTKKVLKKLETESLGMNDVYSRTVDYFRNLSDGIGLTANQDNNFGVLSGIVYKDSTSNPANNAYVFVLEKSTQEFVGAYVTKSSGRYSVPSLKEGEEYLVGVDWFDPSNNTFYGEEKSINFTDTD